MLKSLLFNAMIVHCYHPSKILKSTVISLLKDKTASLSSSNNYSFFRSKVSKTCFFKVIN